MSIAEIIRQRLAHGEGFKEGKPAKDVVRLADLMKKHEEYAGKTLGLWCKEGKYSVTYNDNGYAVKAVRL